MLAAAVDDHFFMQLVQKYIHTYYITYMDCDQHVVNKYSWDIYVFSTYIYIYMIILRYISYRIIQ